MKIIIAGGRSLSDYTYLKKCCNAVFKSYPPNEIVSGTAKGTDQLGEALAKEMGFSLKQFKPNWALHGRGAGIRRNELMAQYADVLIAFWDGKSKGTKSMIELAQKRGLIVKIFNY